MTFPHFDWFIIAPIFSKFLLCTIFQLLSYCYRLLKVPFLYAFSISWLLLVALRIPFFIQSPNCFVTFLLIMKRMCTTLLADQKLSFILSSRIWTAPLFVLSFGLKSIKRRLVSWITSVFSGFFEFYYDSYLHEILWGMYPWNGTRMRST